MERVCEEYNKWSGEKPQCSPVTCNKPSSIGNGWLTPDQQSYNYNSTIKLACFAGYEVRDGKMIGTCLEYGNWSLEPLQCVRIICNDTNSVRHEYIDAYPNVAFNEVENVTYNSSFFHLLNGSAEVYCSEDRKLSWLNSPEFGTLYVCFVALYMYILLQL